MGKYIGLETDFLMKKYLFSCTVLFVLFPLSQLNGQPSSTVDSLDLFSWEERDERGPFWDTPDYPFWDLLDIKYVISQNYLGLEYHLIERVQDHKVKNSFSYRTRPFIDNIGGQHIFSLDITISDFKLTRKHLFLKISYHHGFTPLSIISFPDYKTEGVTNIFLKIKDVRNYPGPKEDVQERIKILKERPSSFFLEPDAIFNFQDLKDCIYNEAPLQSDYKSSEPFFILYFEFLFPSDKDDTLPNWLLMDASKTPQWSSEYELGCVIFDWDKRDLFFSIKGCQY